VRLKTITWNNAPEVITLKLDKHYWPAYELVRSDAGWERRPLEGDAVESPGSGTAAPVTAR
jgi:hypothetical protein